MGAGEEGACLDARALIGLSGLAHRRVGGFELLSAQFRPRLRCWPIVSILWIVAILSGDRLVS